MEKLGGRLGLIALLTLAVVAVSIWYVSRASPDHEPPLAKSPESAQPASQGIESDSAEPPPSPKKALKVRIGYLPIAASLPLFVAKGEGYFKEAGIEVEMNAFRSSNELAVAGVAGRVDVLVTCATNAALDASHTSGKQLVAFLSNGYVKGGEGRRSTDFLIGRPGLDLKDLKGKKIAFFPGSVSKVFAKMVLPKHGLSLNDIEYLEMLPGEWRPALKSGTIDAVNAVEPFASQIIGNKEGEVLIDGFFAEVQPGVPLSGAWFANRAYASKHGERIVGVFEKALKKIGTDRPNSVAHYGNYTRIPPEVYPTIGLNDWQLTTSQATRDKFEAFRAILETNQAIKGIPKTNWFWQGR